MLTHQDEVEAKVELILQGYSLGVAAAAILGEDPPESPLAEIRAIREESLSEFLGAA